MEKYQVTVSLCTSCIKIYACDNADEFRNTIKKSLEGERPDFDWAIQPAPCQRVCREGMITMGVSSSKNPSDIRMTVSRHASEDAVVKEILSFFRPRHGP